MDNRFLKLKKLSQQLGLFAPNDEGVAEPTGAAPPEADKDRLNLNISWSDYVVPEEEVALREAIIKKLLEAQPERDKQSIVDEIIKLRAGPSFEWDIKKYLNQFPELKAKDPEQIDERQLRLPGSEPAIRFMPRTEELEQQKQDILRTQDEAKKRKEELRALWNKERGTPLSHWSEDRQLREFSEEEGLEPLPQKLDDHVVKKLVDADISISQKKYNDLEGKLREKYLAVKAKEDNLRSMILSAKESMPKEPESAALRSVKLRTINDYRNDLKERIIYLSHKVITDSAKWSVFGMPQPEALRDNWHYRSEIGLFGDEDQQFVDDPSSLGDYLQRTPTLLDSTQLLGWHSVPSAEKYFDAKNKRLEAYEDSLNRATKSYGKGLRFLKRLDSMLTKALEDPLGKAPQNIVEFVEREMREEVELAYAHILGALYKEADDASRERHYNHYGHDGAFNIDSYSRDLDEKERRGLSLFDIDKLFHNKIKFYEVIDNFESLISVLVNQPLRKFSNNYFRPTIKASTRPISEEILNDIFGENLSALNDFVAITTYGRERSNSDRPLPNGVEDRDEKAQAVVRSWINASAPYGGSKDYNSVLAYPKFIIKDKDVAGNVVRDMSLKLALSIAQVLFADPDRNLEGMIFNEISNSIKSGKIKLKGASISIDDKDARIKDSVMQAIMKNSDKIKKAVLPLLFRKNILSEKISLMYSRHSEFSSLMQRDDDYSNLAKVLRPTEEKYRASSGRFNKYVDDENAVNDTLSRVLINSADGVAGASELSGSFKQVLNGFDKKYVNGIYQIFSLFHDWNLNDVEVRFGDEVYTNKAEYTHTEEVLKQYMEPFILGDRGNIRLYLERALKTRVTNPSLPQSSDTDNDEYRSTLAIFSSSPTQIKNIYKKIALMDRDTFKDVLQRLAGYAKTEHRVDDNYSSYAEQVNDFNAFVDYFAENLGPAKTQLDTLINTAVYTNMFAGRLNTFGSVGPRKIRKAIQSSKKKATKEFGLTMFNPWIKQALAGAEEVIDKMQVDPWTMQQSRHAGVIGDPIAEYWANGGAEASGTYADKPSVLTVILKKRFNITDEQEVRRIYAICDKVMGKGSSHRNYGIEDIKKLVPVIFDNMDNIESKLKKLIKLSEFAHNNAANMSVSFYRNVFNDPNFKNLGTNATVGKYFDMCTKLNRMGGLASVRRKYKGEIEALRINGMLERGFLKTLRESYRACREGVKISPNLEGLDPAEENVQRDIRSKLESVDTMLTAITEYSALSQFNERVIKKDPALFNLNWSVPSRNFRFRVLKTFDPYHFRVGADTGCCQRLGGLGQPAAVDSYINPLAGVLVLDLKTEDGWKLASQSYFHYVPRDGSYILDNVEKNYSISRRVIEITGYRNLETLYAMLAKYAKETLDVDYFLSGLGYSKIDSDSFGRRSLGSDPRNFSVSKKYTDWKARGSINLLEPTFDSPDIQSFIPKKKRKKKKDLEQKLASLSLWLYKNSFEKESGFITELKREVTEDMAVQMEDLENKYFSHGYAQDYEDILDDMQQAGASGVIYTDEEEQVKGYLYGFELVLEDQVGLSGNFDEEDIEESLESFTCYSEECSLDPRGFLENIISLADDGDIFYVSNFLVDKPHRRVVSELIHMLVKEVKDRGYKYMAFNALSATHRLLMSEGSPSKKREEKFGIKVLCGLDMYAPLFIVEVI